MSATGTGVLARFMLRRNRRAIAIWVTVTGLLVLLQSTQSQSLYDSPEKLAQLRATLGSNAAITALSGPTDLLATIGGEVVFEIFTFLAILLGLMNAFMVGGNTRGDEESGRTELLRSRVLGRHAPLLAATSVAAIADLAAAAVVALLAVATGLPVAGSLLFGAALGAFGVLVAGLTALAAQVFTNTRAVYGSVAAVIGVMFALRAAGDAGDRPWLAWLSPMAWGQRALPYVEDRWWLLALPLATAGLLLAAAVLTLDRRDFGAGVVPDRPGSPVASPLLSSPLGLVWRLDRGALLGWSVGAFALGLVYGSLGTTIEDFVRDNPEIAEFLTGGADRIVDAFLAISTTVTVLLALGYSVSVLLRSRTEEAEGRAELLLAAPVSRAGWLSSHLAMAGLGGVLVAAAGGLGLGLSYGLAAGDGAQVPRLVAVALAYTPAIMVVTGVATLLIGVLPRLAAPVAWAFVAYVALVAVVGDALGLPGWARSLSPVDLSPLVPLDPLEALPLLLLALLAAALVAAGLTGMRRRDLQAG